MRSRIAQYISSKRKIILFLVCFVFGLSIYANSAFFFMENRSNLKYFPPFIEGVNHNQNQLLGAEYYFIARAIVAGKGFSNPFQVDTGPTAWMPPLYSFFLAVLIYIFKYKLIVGGVIVLLKNLVLVFTGMMIYETAKKTFRTIPPVSSILLYAVFLLVYFRWFFQLTHDSWLLLFLVCVLFLYADTIIATIKGLKRFVSWGILGGVCILASPILGMVWLALSMYVFLRTADKKKVLCSFALFLCMCAPWFIRNYMVFDKIILMKSNAFHDLLFYNYQNPYEGLVFEPFEIDNCLVWNAKKNPDCLYRTAGEMMFLETLKNRFFQEIKNDPLQFLSNIKNRFMSAFLIYYPHSVHHTAGIFKIVFHALPFFGILVLIVGRKFDSRTINLALGIYILYLAPYIIVSYYIRYAVPLIPFKVLLSLCAFDHMASGFRAADHLKKLIFFDIGRHFHYNVFISLHKQLWRT